MRTTSAAADRPTSNPHPASHSGQIRRAVRTTAAVTASSPVGVRDARQERHRRLRAAAPVETAPVDEEEVGTAGVEVERRNAPAGREERRGQAALRVEQEGAGRPGVVVVEAALEAGVEQTEEAG